MCGLVVATRASLRGRWPKQIDNPSPQKYPMPCLSLITTDIIGVLKLCSTDRSLTSCLGEYLAVTRLERLGRPSSCERRASVLRAKVRRPALEASASGRAVKADISAGVRGFGTIEAQALRCFAFTVSVVSRIESLLYGAPMHNMKCLVARGRTYDVGLHGAQPRLCGRERWLWCEWWNQSSGCLR